MVGDDALLAGTDDARLALETGDDAIDGLFEVVHRHCRPVVACGLQGRLIHQVGQVGADEPHRARRDAAYVDGGVERHPAHVDPEDLLTAADVGAIEHDLAIEASGAHERGVEDLRAVGGGEDHHALRRVEAVHLGEQLVEGLLALLVATDHRPGAARTT